MTNYAYRVDTRIAAQNGYGTTLGEVSTSSLAAALTALETNSTAVPFPLTYVGDAAAGAAAFPKRIEGIVTAVSSDAATSIYRMVGGVPVNAKIKKVSILSAIASAGSADVDVAWSLDPTKVPPGETPGAVIQINSADNKLFGAAQSLVLSSVRTDFTFAGTFLPKHLQMPLWEVLGTGNGYGGGGGGLTVPRTWTDNPGGEFDLILTITTAVTTGGVVLMEVDFAD